MSPGATGGGLVHQAALYHGDEQFLELVIPFVHDGLEAGELTLVALDERHNKLVESVVPPGPGLSFLTETHARPASTLKSFATLFRGHLSRGARRIRLVGEVPHPTTGASWHWWARYEATVNHALAEFPLWGLCLYDRCAGSDEVLADVIQTHPYLTTPDGQRVVNERYTDPAAFLTQPRSPRADPLETSAPVIELMNPAPGAARRAVRQVANATRLSTDDVQDLMIAVSETVTNAACHGCPPTRLRVWSAPERIVVTVTDQGRGPADPFAGLRPAAKAPAGGLGLWLTHHLCDLVTLDQGEDSFTVRLIAGDPGP